MKNFLKAMIIFSLLLTMAGCGEKDDVATPDAQPPKDQVDIVEYTWPVADSLSTEIEYSDGGEIKYVQPQTGYADASGVYEDVGYWTIYIENAELGDVEKYIAQLKSCGFSYFSFDEAEEEPDVEFVWPGYFMWDGASEKNIVKIYLYEENQERENREINKTFYYNLRLELLDKNVWKQQ